MWSRIQTIFTVIILTCFIWIFAERQVTRSIETPLDIRLDERMAETHPGFLVEILDEDDEPVQGISVKLSISGPTGRIQELQEGRIVPREPVITLETLGLGNSVPREPQIYEIAVVRELLEGELSLEGRDTFFQVTHAEPSRLRIRVTPLEQRMTSVLVCDMWRDPINNAETEPGQVPTWVIPGEAAEARVILGLDQQIEATRGYIPVTATVLAARREQSFAVEVRLPAGEAGLEGETGTISLPKLGEAWPAGMRGQYRVVMEDDTGVRDLIQYRGSSAAMREFETAHYHWILEVYPEDRNRTTVNRVLRYNLPNAEGPFEIVNPKRIMVSFHLEEVSPSENSLDR
ncbi:MAG: hypothetical protein JW936_04340 [Sedimentisphaerales bacterium]|nr:hypothetical protein [Sedimentisphaerales bacterium]